MEEEEDGDDDEETDSLTTEMEQVLIPLDFLLGNVGHFNLDLILSDDS